MYFILNSKQKKTPFQTWKSVTTTFVTHSDILNTLGNVFYKKHWWSHYLSLLISCFPVFILYYVLFISKLIPEIISIVGIIAVILMFIEILFSVFGNSISMNMLLPIGLIQLILPIWLILKGLNSSVLETEMN